MNEAGWEIATHGYKWIDYRDTPAERRSARHRRGDQASTRWSPARGRSASTRGARRSTRSGSAARRAASSIAPTPTPTICPIGSRGRRGRSSIVPYTLDANDMRFATRRASIPATSSSPISRIRSTRSTPRARPRRRCCRSACTAGWSGGRAAPPRWRASSTTSPAYDKVWIATRLDIARHWIAKHPPAGGWKPSRLSRTLFVERFGGVYEHSRWVAEAAYDAG